MKTSCNKNFRPKGPYAAMTVPFSEQGTLNEQMLRKETEFLVESGISGLFPCGSTGEFVHFSIDENCRILDIIADQAANRIDIIPGTCTTNVEATLKLVKHCEDLGCPAVVICPPYYTTMSQDSVYCYYQSIAKSTDMNIILYNIPMFTNEISLEVFRKLLPEKNIIGIKDSSANMKKIMNYIQITKEERPDFAVMTGTDEIIFPALMAGCTGSMTAFSGIVPEINTQIYRYFYEKNYEKALELQLSIIKLLRLADSIDFPVGYKAILDKRGLKMGRSRQVAADYDTELYFKLGDKIKNELIQLFGENYKIAI